MRVRRRRPPPVHQLHQRHGGGADDAGGPIGGQLDVEGGPKQLLGGHGAGRGEGHGEAGPRGGVCRRGSARS